MPKNKKPKTTRRVLDAVSRAVKPPSKQGERLRAGAARWKRRVSHFGNQVSISVSPELKADIEALADAENKSVSQVAREALQKGLPLLGAELGK